MNTERTKEFCVCPECQYQRGFHVFFNKAKGKTRIGLICHSADIHATLDGLMRE